MIKKISKKIKETKLGKKSFQHTIFYIAVGIFVLYFAVNTLKPKPQISDMVEETPLMTVRVQTVNEQATQGSIIVNGQTEAGLRMPLKSRTNGKIEKILIQKGQFVQKDEVIMTLTQDDRNARLSAVRAKIKDAQFRYNTTKELVDQGFESSLSLAKEKATLEAAQAELKSIQQDIDYTLIKAPFDGIFDHKFVEQGDVITTASELGIFVSLNPMLIQSNLPEKYFGQIKQNDFVKAEFPNTHYSIGKVVYISNILDQKTRTFLVEVEIPNDDLNTAVGQTAKLTFMLDQEHGFYLNNQSLLTLDANGTLGVKVVENGTVQFMPVEIIKTEGQALWVSGLYDGAKVISLGGEFTEVGQKVKTVEDNASTKEEINE
ncbi:MAG: efflux RND transporter periplasmic adaptor subunit [Rickettsiales bacterium]|jgi:multidrug efflux system membrane fusion protein|nr:efflux RND transporter periplasmic adaptor subunit [Rickettsiales bacterium]